MCVVRWISGTPGRVPEGQEAGPVERARTDCTAPEASGARAQIGLAGLAGWLGLQNAAKVVPKASAPYGRGPPGCGAAANKHTHVLVLCT